MKNCILPFLILFVSLLSGQEVIAQTRLELSAASSSTTTPGPTTATQTATLLENTTGTTFVAATPATSVSVSFSNQQYTGTYGNISRGVVFGAVATTTSTNVAATTLFQSMSSVGSPVSSTFTSSPCGPAGTGIDVNANYAYRIFTSSKPLIGQPTTARYQFADVTLTFNRPVNNPVIQIVGLGGTFNNGTANQAFTAELELVLPATGITLSELSGSAELNVTANKILNSAATPSAACGTGGLW